MALHRFRQATMMAIASRRRTAIVTFSPARHRVAPDNAFVQDLDIRASRTQLDQSAFQLGLLTAPSSNHWWRDA